MAEQNFNNHARLVPGYHFVLATILLANLVWTIRHLLKAPDAQHGMDVAVACALVLLFLYARRFALTVQDRVIRLEMDLRLERLLPAELRVRRAELSLDQLVALRFASDGELAGLTRRVLDEKLLDRKAIKRLIQHWQPDSLRA